MSSVLGSSVYDPSRTPEQVSLYGLMNSGVPSDELMDEFREMVTSMPTANPYEGVLFNPRACEVDQISSDLDQIVLTLEDYLDDIPTQLTPEEVHEWKSSIPNLISDLEHAKQIMQEYRDHTDRLLANFPTISSIVQSEISKSAGAISSSNPCAGFGDIMGSILKQGQDIMSEILSATADVMANLQPVLELIENSITKLMSNIAQAKEKILEEVDLIAESMLRDRKMNLAQMLNQTWKDPCLGSLMGELTTGEAQTILDSGT